MTLDDSPSHSLACTNTNGPSRFKDLNQNKDFIAKAQQLIDRIEAPPNSKFALHRSPSTESKIRTSAKNILSSLPIFLKKTRNDLGKNLSRGQKAITYIHSIIAEPPLSLLIWCG
jgi:hypothetical protein